MDYWAEFDYFKEAIKFNFDFCLDLTFSSQNVL